ncbi:hypothetical protein ACP70R_007257 [Stipagrostis hirtigluma subsp. patula]
MLLALLACLVPFYILGDAILTLTVQSVGCDDFTRKVDQILKKHSGVGVKTVNLEFIECYEANASNYLDSWLQIAITPRIEALTLKVFSDEFLVDEFSDDEFSDNGFSRELKYKFPCSLLSDGNGSSIQYLRLECCTFQPQLGCLGSLTWLHLDCVRITGDELGCLLSNSLVLERLELSWCFKIISLKIPCLLHRLNYLHVWGCRMLREIDNQAQNLCRIYLGDFPALYTPRESLHLGELLHLKSIDMMSCSNAYYARAEIPSIAPNVETLTVGSLREMVDTPMAPSKFVHLKHLTIRMFRVNLSPAYDYFSLSSFIDASPNLETFRLSVPPELMEHDSIFASSADLRQMPQCHHHKLQSFKITLFCSVKSLIELTCHILENTTSLEHVTLDTTFGSFRCSDNNVRCHSMPEDNIMEAHKALLSIETYIKTKVPDKLNVVEPCRRCHTIEL